MSTHPAWKGDEATYAAAHQYVRAKRGPARLYDCVSCFKQAQHWSFVGRESKALWGPAGNSPTEFPYSRRLDDYVPMCVKCNLRYGTHRRRRPVKPEELEPVESVRKLAGVPRLPRRWDADIEAWAA